jgi:hypothetical protein
MLGLAEQALGAKLEILERWQGVYGALGPGPFTVLNVAPGLSAVLMHSGVA